MVQRSAPIELEYSSPRPREFLVFPKEDALPVAPGECLGWAVSEKSNAMITHDNLGPSNPELIWHGEDYLWAATGNPYLGRMSDVRRFRARIMVSAPESETEVANSCWSDGYTYERCCVGDDPECLRSEVNNFE